MRPQVALSTIALAAKEPQQVYRFLLALCLHGLCLRLPVSR
jgi:hypothetical protein